MRRSRLQPVWSSRSFASVCAACVARQAHSQPAQVVEADFRPRAVAIAVVHPQRSNRWTTFRAATDAVDARRAVARGGVHVADDRVLRACLL